MVKARELRKLRSALAKMRAEIAARAEHDHVMIAIDIDPVRML
jgi:hypothetical protein